MKKILICASCLVLLGACTKDIERFNEDTKRPPEAPPTAPFSNAVRNLVDGITSPSVNVNVYRFTVQHWAMTTYNDEVQYDFLTRAIPQAWWTRMYRDVLNDLNESAKLITDDVSLPAVPATTKTNQLAMIDIMKVYAFHVLVNTFGNIPYTEALNINALFPKYDDAKTVYSDLLTKLTAATAKLNTTAGGMPAAQDFIGQGSVGKWIKFANSLQVRMAMIIADVDDAKAKSFMEAADTKAISSAADDVIFSYLGSSPNTNPIWLDIVQSGRADYVSAKPLVDTLVKLSDPRLSLFYRPNNAGNWVGGVVGTANTFNAVARPHNKFSAPDLPSTIIDYMEMEFFRAEAKERGYAIAGTATQHYNNAITASIIAWGGTAADAATYLARPDVAYATATGTWRQKIGIQKWIALYNRPVEGWTEIRRLDFPVLNPPVGAKSGFPNRFTYPANEQVLNGTNYTAAAAAIGGDKVETKLFWDKF